MSKRITTAALDAHLDQAVTAVGYLVYIGLTPDPLRWCDLNDHDYASFLWTRVDFTVSGLSFDVETPASDVTIEVQNIDSAMGALLQQANLADTPVVIYQMARGLSAAGDAPQMIELSIDGGEITPTQVKLKCKPLRASTQFFPRRRVDAAFGFNFAMPEGKTIVWGSETFVIERSE